MDDFVVWGGEGPAKEGPQDFAPKAKVYRQRTVTVLHSLFTPIQTRGGPVTNGPPVSLRTDAGHRP